MVVHDVIASAVGITAGLRANGSRRRLDQAGPIDHLYNVLIVIYVPIFVTVMIDRPNQRVNFRMRPGEEDLDGPPLHGKTRGPPPRGGF